MRVLRSSQRGSRRSCGRLLAWLIGTALCFVLCASARADLPRTAFFYGKPVPPELFAHYDRVIVQAENLGAPPPAGSTRGEAFAYVSIGEIADTHALHDAAPRACFFGRNPGRGSDVADLTHKEWRTFVLDRLIEPLWTRGYRGFFLDTLDSFELGAKTPDARAAQSRGLAALQLGSTVADRGPPIVGSTRFVRIVTRPARASLLMLKRTPQTFAVGGTITVNVGAGLVLQNTCRSRVCRRPTDRASPGPEGSPGS